MPKLPMLVVLLLAPILRADISGCACDPSAPETMEARECGLSREAQQQPSEPPVFFLKDINPRKPNRWLALPRPVRKGVYRLSDMTPEERLQLWIAAIEKAKELWGDDWGIAKNGDLVRTQCHPHVHIGRFVQAAETPHYIVVDGPEQIPVPQRDGLWIHPHGNKLHVHTGEQLTETVLLR